MKNYVVENYENYREEDRLSTNNARRIEYLTTVRILDELIDSNQKILDCAAGTGIYAFHFAQQGNEVTATDITPRHVDIMEEIIAQKGIDMKTAVLDANLANQLISTGVLRHDDEKCFWTDTYYSSADEMERIYRKNGLTVIDHFAQDGMTPQFCEKVDKWSEEQFETWCNYHYSVCREKSTLGASNHVVIVGRK